MDPLGLFDDPKSLLRKKLAASTRRAYRKGAARFCHWAALNSVSVCTVAELDRAFLDFMADFVKEHRGRYRTRVSHALYGLQYAVVGAAKQMPLSTRALLNWASHQPTRSWPPLTWSSTLVIAAVLLQRGKPLMAIMTLISFHCLLRVGEATQLRASDFADANDPRVDSGFRAQAAGAFRLRHTKTGPNQWVVLLDARLAALVRLVVAARGGGDPRLFACSSAQYRREFKAACAAVRLSPDYVPHSLRHGGATHLRVVAGWTVEDIMERGRWQASKSARRYIQQGPAIALAVAVPAQVSQWGERLAVLDLVAIFAPSA